MEYYGSMIKIKVPQNITQHCLDLIERYDFGNVKAVAKGTKQQELTGLIGQCIIAQELGLPLVEGGQGFDGGFDLVYNGLKVDVKTMGRSVDVQPDYVNHFYARQKRFNADAYVFCSYNKNKNELTICGWITKDAFFKKAKFYPKGTRRYQTSGAYFCTRLDMYEIPNTELLDFTTLKEIQNAN
jgi:hypothetical protein